DATPAWAITFCNRTSWRANVSCSTLDNPSFSRGLNFLWRRIVEAISRGVNVNFSGSGPGCAVAAPGKARYNALCTGVLLLASPMRQGMGREDLCAAAVLCRVAM